MSYVVTIGSLIYSDGGGNRMSAYSTLSMTKAEVLSLIHAELSEASNEKLEQIAGIFLEDRLYNCQIVSQEFKDSTKEC